MSHYIALSIIETFSCKLLMLRSEAKEPLIVHISKNLKPRKIKITVKVQHYSRSFEQL
jgi:hypothetical protein